MKRNHQAKDILKEDCQAFGTIIAKTLILYEAFQYPITSVPLSIAPLDRELRQSKNAFLRHFFINISNATINANYSKCHGLQMV